MNAIKCLICGGKYFRKVYYEIDVDVDIYPTVYNSVNVKNKDLNDVNVDVDTIVDNKIDANGDISP